MRTEQGPTRAWGQNQRREQHEADEYSMACVDCEHPRIVGGCVVPVCGTTRRDMGSMAAVTLGVGHG